MTDKKVERVWLETVPKSTDSLEVQRRRQPIWHEHYLRVLRLLKRLENTDRSREEYTDDLMSFFQSCWHLTDWLVKDLVLPDEIRRRVKDDVESQPALLVCRDLAIAAKHLEVWPARDTKAVLGTMKKTTTKTTRGGGRAEADVQVTETVLDVVMELPVPAERLPDGTYDDIAVTHRPALEVAHEAVDAWQALLTEYGLLNDDGDPVPPAQQLTE